MCVLILERVSTTLNQGKVPMLTSRAVDGDDDRHRWIELQYGFRPSVDVADVVSVDEV